MLATLVAPASAYHEYGYGHWYRGDPGAAVVPQIHDRNNTVRNGFAFARDAGDFWWSQSGYRYGPYLWSLGGNPYDCGWVYWAAVICTGDAGYGNNASTRRMYFLDANGAPHTLACAIRLRPNLAANDYELRAIMRHELGHCGGLGHNDYQYSVMSYNAPTINATQHDRDAVSEMYGRHAGPDGHWHGNN